MRPKKFTPTQLEEFNRRFLKIDALIPGDFVKKALDIDPTLGVNRIQNVRYNGKIKDFHILDILEQITQPIIEKLEK